MRHRFALIALFATCTGLHAQTDNGLKIVKRERGPTNDPLVMAQFRAQQTLPRDAEFGYFRKTWLRVMLGKPGSAKNTFIAYYYNCVRNRGPLQAEFRFPSQKPGVVIQRKDTLKMRG